MARRKAAPAPPAGELPVERVPIADLKPDPKNVRLHGPANLEAIKASLSKFGQRKPVVVSRNYTLVAGNGTLAAAVELGWDALWVTVFPGTAAEARAYAIADNRTAELAEWDVAGLLASLQTFDDDVLAAVGYTADDMAGLAAILDLGLPAGSGLPGTELGALAERFGVAPFTLLDARQGPWRARKRAWLALGVESELGRSGKLLGGGLGRAGQGSMPEQMVGMRSEAGRDARLGRTGKSGARNNDWQGYTTTADGTPKGRQRSGAYGAQATTGADGRLEYETTTGATSIFDPVLCELVYRWFSADGQAVLDPWAGGSVRGIVASRLGRAYTGIDLSPEQIAANTAQRHLAAKPLPHWIEGESAEQLGKLRAESADLIFGCPPYYDLERYTDDPRDLSTMTRTAFDKAMLHNIAAAARCLRPDSFAVFVVGNVRDKSGTLLDMRALMVACCAAAGLRFYNDAILITPAGSLPVRAGRTFTASRILGRTHQEVLVFVKGNRKAAAARVGVVDVEQELYEAAASGRWDEDGDGEADDAPAED